MPEDSKKDNQAELLQAVIVVAVSAWQIWYMLMTPHQRQAVKMRLFWTIGRLTGSAARRAGAASMRAELATGTENYHLAYGLALARERLAAAYDRTRSITP